MNQLLLNELFCTIELKNPHQMAVSREGDTIYVTEIGPNRIRKFNVVAPQDNIFNQEM